MYISTKNTNFMYLSDVHDSLFCDSVLLSLCSS